GRTADDAAIDAESRAVARAIPRALGGIPADETTQVCAHGGFHAQRTGLAPVCRNIIVVLFDLVPGAADVLAIDVKQIGPSIATVEDAIARHHAGQRPERDAVAG